MNSMQDAVNKANFLMQQQQQQQQQQNLYGFLQYSHS